ncbi:MAG: 50S ribosomal protein L15 [Candidatus Heimdallarchaeota archaeon]|nr:MAG: 50S ribosomal protein L15 [Candidatus Heimdallarchaeota archaeon]
MTVRKRKKVRRERGYRTHGWGIVRTHRGSGMRGGVGKAAPMSHHWIQTVKGLRPPVGKRGFVRPPAVTEKTYQINISHLEAMIPSLLNEGLIVKKGEKFEIKLEELGYTKLLAQGDITLPMSITVNKASEKAIAKIKKAGGKVNLIE